MAIANTARTAILVLLIASPAFSANHIFPQVPVGGGYSAKITLSHADLRSLTPAQGRLSFFNPDGTPRTVVTRDHGTASSFSVAIPYESSVTFTLPDVGPVSVGSAKYEDVNSIVVGGVASYALFGESSVGVISALRMTRGWVPLSNTSGFSTGIAASNPSDTNPVTVQFETLNANGSTGQAGSTVTIPPNGQIARIVGPETGFNNPIAPNSTLQIRVVGTGEFAATALILGNNYISSTDIFNDEYPSNLLTPTYLPQVVAGGQYSMIINSLNLSPAAANFRIRFFDQAGRPLQADITASSAAGTVTTAATDTAIVPAVPARGRVEWSVRNPLSLSVGYARVDAYTQSATGVESPVETQATGTILDGPYHIGVKGAGRHYSMAIGFDLEPGENVGFGLAFPDGRIGTLRARLTAGGMTYTTDRFPATANGGTHFAMYITEAFRGVPTTGLKDALLSIDSDGGGFVPVALFQDRVGRFSSTAYTRRLTHNPTALAGLYNGMWNNTTLRSTGAMSLETFILPGTTTARMILDLAGDTFFGRNPPPETWTCNLGVNGCWGTTTSPFFGRIKFGVECDGTQYFRGSPGGSGVFGMDGFINERRSDGEYFFRAGLTGAIGTYLLTKGSGGGGPVFTRRPD